jgi:hypothetical protein
MSGNKQTIINDNEYNKPEITVTVLNYKKNKWVIIPEHSTLSEVITQINDSRRIDTTYGLFEDIYNNMILINIYSSAMLNIKIQLKYSKYNVKIIKKRLL